LGIVRRVASFCDKLASLPHINPKLAHHEHPGIGHIAQPQVQQLAAAVADGALYPEKDGFALRVAGGGGLEQGGHLAGVERVAARVVLAGDQ
jgi:hypothetical protein